MIKPEHYDILVVGTGPAGSSAAAEAAHKGLRVLMVERRPVVGVPVQCAEYIPAPLLGELDLEKRYIVQSVKGLKTFLNGREINDTPARGFIIRRNVFDHLLLEKAREKGAEVMLATRALSRSGDRVVIRTRNRPAIEISAGVIVGADGPLSTVAGWIGAGRPPMIAATQVRAPLTAPLDHALVYFEPEFYAGYAWLFPRGSHANVGLGIRKKTNAAPPLAALLRHFLAQRLSGGLIGTKVSHRISGWIPSGLRDRIVHENVLLAGDAAGQTHPITGAGIFPAVTCGRMAGRWAARAASAGDISLLARYETEYLELFGDTMRRAGERRRQMEADWDRLGEILKHCWVVFKEYYAAA